MPAIVSEFQANPTPLRGGDWGAYLHNLADIDEDGRLVGPHAHGSTETAARMALMWRLFEDVEPEYLKALCEEMERRGDDCGGSVRVGWYDACKMLRHLLDVEGV